MQATTTKTRLSRRTEKSWLSAPFGYQAPEVFGRARKRAFVTENSDFNRDTPALIARQHKRTITDGFSRQHLGDPRDAQSALRHRFQGTGERRGRTLLHEHGAIMTCQHGIDNLAERRSFREIKVLNRGLPCSGKRMDRQTLGIGSGNRDQTIRSSNRRLEKRLIEPQVRVRVPNAEHKVTQPVGKIPSAGIHVRRERRVILVGANPTQQLSLRLVAARAVRGGNEMD